MRLPLLVNLMSAPNTFPALLLNHAAQRANAPATREKYLGIWQTWSWSEVATQVRFMACGLASLGFKPHNSLAIIGELMYAYLTMVLIEDMLSVAFAV